MICIICHIINSLRNGSIRRGRIIYLWVCLLKIVKWSCTIQSTKCKSKSTVFYYCIFSILPFQIITPVVNLIHTAGKMEARKVGLGYMRKEREKYRKTERQKDKVFLPIFCLLLFLPPAFCLKLLSCLPSKMNCNL